MRQRLGSALRDNLDLLVEFSTLGEYRLMDPGEAAQSATAGRAITEPAARLPLPTGPRTCSPARVRACLPATPPPRRKRAGAPEPPEQVCLAADA
jgi:hypothetical protein